MLMKDFCDKLNRSSWQGIISEAGFGLPFSSEYLDHPGASQTILQANCDYAGLDTINGMRAVSLENVQRQADANLGRAIAEAALDKDISRMFGLSISCAHYADRDSHAWICLATKDWEAYMHFTIDHCVGAARKSVGTMATKYIVWFLQGCLVPEESWSDHIANVPLSLDTHHIDVLYAPGVSDSERLGLLHGNNVLVYDKGKFQRVIDYLRDYGIIYSGSFNPVTKAHLRSDHCLFEISQSHCYKGFMSLEDMMHRVKMLSIANRPVLLTQCPRFVDKHKMLMSHVEKQYSFIIGADAWNATIAAHQYPSTEYLNDNMPNADFLIRGRPGVEIQNNLVSNTLNFAMLPADESEVASYNSTEVRDSESPGTHEYVLPEVGEYIESRGLYRSNQPLISK